jgi:hypothetical protein
MWGNPLPERPHGHWHRRPRPHSDCDLGLAWTKRVMVGKVPALGTFSTSSNWGNRGIAHLIYYSVIAWVNLSTLIKVLSHRIKIYLRNFCRVSVLLYQFTLVGEPPEQAVLLLCNLYALQRLHIHGSFSRLFLETTCREWYMMIVTLLIRAVRNRG